MHSSPTRLRRTLLASLCGLFIAATPPLLAADRMATGQWELALTTDGATHTVSQCVTPAETGSVNGDAKTARAFAEKKAAGRCALKSFEIQGDTVSYSLACGDRLIASTATYHGSSFEGTLTTTVQGKAAITHVKGRRLGACP